MTDEERDMANALLKCTFQPASFDKSWVKQLPNWSDREMTPKGKEMLKKLYYKYRKQINNGRR